ncbi:hypothetical protein DICPUDRAFT_89068 [Dictyostelium purpureum]|uniref:Uncharacterized protein n=1 Tax=Dictyostelium purpureum TaxID=5786 RepID=F0ZTG6_DICPU|nr:uncharacterized protein DICPUDRAFT_89068 [Dictyostelium purpureum]EGC32757.1 hypothetical protein DICPUDRAFT_89068 [Dictyostelium purpureum]|eukprot:XP_003290720.1 hypothetical protein DICPUDRAFT_89068 [Dictyostelium purpureum]
MSNKIIKQQLKILNGEELRVNKRFQKLKSPLNKVIENKVDQDEVLKENLKLLQKKKVIKTESKAAQKKRDIINSNIEKENSKIQEKIRMNKRLQKQKKEKRRAQEMFSVQMH